MVNYPRKSRVGSSLSSTTNLDTDRQFRAAIVLVDLTQGKCPAAHWMLNNGQENGGQRMIRSLAAGSFKVTIST